MYRSNKLLESFILDICVRYLLLSEIGDTPLFSENENLLEVLCQDPNIFEDNESSAYDTQATWEALEDGLAKYDPTERGFGELFVYASSYWLKHYGHSEDASRPSIAGVESLCQANSLRLHNWLNQYSRPECTIKARFEFDSNICDPLRITALYGSHAMLRRMLEEADFSSGKYLPSSVMVAADQVLYCGDLSRLRLLLHEGKLASDYKVFLQLVIWKWAEVRARCTGWELAFELVDDVLDRLVAEQWGRELFCVAARFGCLPMMRILVDRAKHNTILETELLQGFQSVGEAVLGNHIHVLEYLLRDSRFDKHFDYLNAQGESVLHIAAGPCNPAMFRLLVLRLQKYIYQPDGRGDTPLTRVIKSDAPSEVECECAGILLSHAHTKDGNDFGDGGNSPLRVAVQLGDIAMVRLLMADGRFDPSSALVKGADAELLLKDKACLCGEAIQEILREHATASSLS